MQFDIQLRVIPTVEITRDPAREDMVSTLQVSELGEEVIHVSSSPEVTEISSDSDSTIEIE